MFQAVVRTLVVSFERSNKAFRKKSV